MFGDGEAETGASRFAGAGFVDTVEALEQARQVFGGNAGAEIADVELDAAFYRPRAQQDSLSRACVLHRVLDQIGENLVDGLAVGVDGRIEAALDGEFHALSADHFPETLLSVVEEF